MKQNFAYNTALGVLASAMLAVPVAAGEMVLHDSESFANTSVGFVNSNRHFGNLISLEAPATITSITVTPVNVMGASGTLTVSFFSLDSGADGVFQTGDDLVGSFLGSFSPAAVTLQPNVPVTLSGPGVEVPANFMWVIFNPGTSATWRAINEDGYQNASLDGANPNIGWWSEAAPTEGSLMRYLNHEGLHGRNSDFAARIEGVIPEPSTYAFIGGLIALIGAVAIRRRTARGR